MERRLILDVCGICEECKEGLICSDVRLAKCCRSAIKEEVGQLLDDISEGMADPQIKSEVAYAAARAIAGHRCDS